MAKRTLQQIISESAARSVKERRARDAREFKGHRLTADATIDGVRMMTPLEYKTHLELLKDIELAEAGDRLPHMKRWRMRDLSDVEWAASKAVHRAGLVRVNASGDHVLTPLGRVYLHQRIT